MSKSFTRRRFVLAGGRMGLLLGAGTLLPWASTRVGASESISPAVDLAVVRGPASQSVERAIQVLGGIERFVKKGDRVVLKPNMGFPNPPNMGTTTSPEVVGRVAALCRQAGAKEVLIVDNPVRRPEVCLIRSGIKEACKTIPKTHVVALRDRWSYREVLVKKGKVLPKVEVMESVLKADVLINMPIAKSHGATGVSLGMKNLMGVIWDRNYFHKKVDLDQAIADLSTVVRCDLTILDASRVLTDGGPGGPGSVAELQTIVAGTDPVAVDGYGVGLAEWYGQRFSPSQVKHILYASQLGVGEIDTGKLQIKKVDLS